MHPLPSFIFLTNIFETLLSARHWIRQRGEDSGGLWLCESNSLMWAWGRIIPNFQREENLKETFIWEFWLELRVLMGNTVKYVVQNSKGTKGYTVKYTSPSHFCLPSTQVPPSGRKRYFHFVCVYSKIFYAHKNQYIFFFFNTDNSQHKVFCTLHFFS